MLGAWGLAAQGPVPRAEPQVSSTGVKSNSEEVGLEHRGGLEKLEPYILLTLCIYVQERKVIKVYVQRSLKKLFQLLSNDNSV